MPQRNPYPRTEGHVWEFSLHVIVTKHGNNPMLTQRRMDKYIVLEFRQWNTIWHLKMRALELHRSTLKKSLKQFWAKDPRCSGIFTTRYHLYRLLKQEKQCFILFMDAQHMWQKYKNVGGNGNGWIHEYDSLGGETEEGGGKDLRRVHRRPPWYLKCVISVKELSSKYGLILIFGEAG